jgi:hypothetical protein
VSARVQALIAIYEKGDKRATARRLGIDASELSRMLSGDWAQFSLDTLGAFVLTYGVSIDWLLALQPSRGAASPLALPPATKRPHCSSGRPRRSPSTSDD